MKKIKFLASILVFSLLLLLLGGCLTSYSGPADSTPIVVIGDSLVDQASNEIKFFYSLDSSYKYSVNGFGGITTCYARDDIREGVSMSPAVLVIALGTNDKTLGWDINNFLCMSDILNNITRNVDVLWIVPNHGGPEVRSVLEYWDRPNVTIGGWDEVSNDPSYYIYDGIHHTTKGRVAYAAFIVQQSINLL